MKPEIKAALEALKAFENIVPNSSNVKNSNDDILQLLVISSIYSNNKLK